MNIGQRGSYDKGAASRPEIMLLVDTYLAGDFDRDGSDDTAVLLVENGGALFFERKQSMSAK
jgi:hypothetical protein